MEAISEKWEIVVGKDKFIVSKAEKDLVLSASEARFVKFRDIVINPAFVVSMKLVEKTNPNQIQAPTDREFTPEELARNRKRIAEIKSGYRKNEKV